MATKKNYGKVIEGFLIFLLLLFCVVVIVGAIIYNSYSNNKNAEFPKMEIKLSDVTLDEINNGDKSVRYYGNSVLIKEHDFEKLVEGVELKGRGNYSWMSEKKSYNIKFPYKISLLGLDKHKKWGMIANSLDDTFLRNDLGHLIVNSVAGKQIVNGDYFELRIDEQDLGLYYLSELISIEKHSVDLRNPFAVLIEFDKVYCGDEEFYRKTDILEDCLALKDVNDENGDKEKLFDGFMADYNAFEKMLLRKEYNEIFDYIDKETWAEYYLASEFTGNVDAYVTSWFLYRDGLEDKIHAGPGWDFDAGFGNRNWADWPDDLYNPNAVMTRFKYSFGDRNDYVEGHGMGCRYDYEGKEGSLAYVSPVMCYMIDIPEFVDEVSRIYKERLMGKREEILNYIHDKAEYIREAAKRDNEMWGKKDFDEAVDYLIWWVDKRFDLFDELYGGRRTEYLKEPLEA